MSNATAKNTAVVHVTEIAQHYTEAMITTRCSKMGMKISYRQNGRVKNKSHQAARTRPPIYTEKRDHISDCRLGTHSNIINTGNINQLQYITKNTPSSKTSNRCTLKKC